LKVTEPACPARRKKPIDDDILNETGDDEPAVANDAPGEQSIDPLAVLKENRCP
jgi:hypothetical protein